MNITLTKAQFDEIVADQKEVMQEAILDAVLDSLTWQVKAGIAEDVKASVREYVQAEVMPEVLAELKKKKAGIVEGASEAADELGPMIKQVIVSKVKANLASYKSNGIVEALFG